jgi:hypothetical protein
MNHTSKKHHTYPDVFDELDNIDKTFPRRFSLSLPTEFDDIQLDSVEKFIEIPSAPPPSPELEYISTERLTIQVPDDDFYIDLNNNAYHSSDDDYKYGIHIKDIQGSLNFSKEELLISSTSDITNYKCPPRISSDARKIWKSANIPRISNAREIEILLLNWAFTYASLEIRDRKIISINWQSKSNCRCQSTWKAFIKWILCACLST